MFSLANLISSLLSPALMVFALRLFDSLFKTELLGIFMLLVYVEHIFIGKLLGIKFEKQPSILIFSFPHNELLFRATIIFDYLVVALIVYVWLTILTRYVFSARNLG